MDVFPQARGHVLVIPKHSRARNILEEEPEILANLMLGVQRVAKAVRAAVQPDGIMIAQFNGGPSGQSVFHLHVHIIPRWDGVALRPHGADGMADPVELKALADKIAAMIA
jgi:histidine triad (HIT) family protein